MCVARLADTDVVPGSSSITQGKTGTPQGRERSTSVGQPSEGNSSNLAQVELPSLSLIWEGLNQYDFVPMCKGRAYGFMELRYLQAIPNVP